jgi:hypothetical protein
VLVYLCAGRFVVDGNGTVVMSQVGGRVRNCGPRDFVVVVAAECVRPRAVTLQPQPQ